MARETHQPNNHKSQSVDSNEVTAILSVLRCEKKNTQIKVTRAGVFQTPVCMQITRDLVKIKTLINK